MEGYTWDTEGKTEGHRATHTKGPTSGAVRHKYELTYLFQFSGREGLLLPFDLGGLATYIEGPAESREVDGWEDFVRQLCSPGGRPGFSSERPGSHSDLGHSGV